MPVCRAYSNNKTPCTHPCKWGSDLCKLHFNSKALRPIQWEVRQEEMKINKCYSSIRTFRYMPLTMGDVEYNSLKKIKMEKRNRILEERAEYQYQLRLEEERFELEPQAGAGAGADALIPAAFHEDNQNVHRQETVVNVKRSVKVIMGIKIDDPDYIWNRFRVSKTPGEIIIRCSLTPAAAVLLIQKYSAADTIYDMVPGIYGKVLDGVLQFITKSEDSVNLFKILKTELEDNVDMCAQGNLSRLCNVLGGYLEGISPASVAEILGDLLPPLMSIDSRYQRLKAAIAIFHTYNVPENEWNDWLESLDCNFVAETMQGTDGRL